MATIPTIQVTSLDEADDPKQVITINQTDFNPDKHKKHEPIKVDKPKTGRASLKPETDTETK